jgi:hypothetical protein
VYQRCRITIRADCPIWSCALPVHYRFRIGRILLNLGMRSSAVWSSFSCFRSAEAATAGRAYAVSVKSEISERSADAPVRSRVGMYPLLRWAMAAVLTLAVGAVAILFGRQVLALPGLEDLRGFCRGLVAGGCCRVDPHGVVDRARLPSRVPDPRASSGRHGSNSNNKCVTEINIQQGGRSGPE